MAGYRLQSYASLVCLVPGAWCTFARTSFGQLPNLCISLPLGQFDAQIHPAFSLSAQVAPVTTQHIFLLASLGLYTSADIFRVDKGFVAQITNIDALFGRLTQAAC